MVLYYLKKGGEKSFGQIYNGQITKGLIMMVSYVLSALACFIVIGFITTPILWVWGIYDAYKNAERVNQVQNATQTINVQAEADSRERERSRSL